MRAIKFLALTGMAVVLFAGAATAQKKPVRKTPVKKTSAPTRVLPPLDVRVGREKVEIQLANVNRFVDVLGPIAQGIELLDDSARTKPLPQATADKNEANKQKVVVAIRNLKAGISDLETEFRTKPLLQKYLPTIEGITDLGAGSEDSALAGKFVAAKEPLRNVARKLTVTLAALPR